jgi:glycosyltransferase involved in cell wall biosynthesis
MALPATFMLSCLVLWRHGFDVIHSSNPPDLFFLVALPFKLLGKKFVFDHHDLMPEICESRWTGWKRALLRTLCLIAERASFRTADRVIANNESFRRIAVTRGHVSPEHVAVVRNAPRLRDFQPLAARPELRNGAGYLVVYLGVMGPNDGLSHLLEAIAYLAHSRDRRDIRFILIGSGDLYDATVAMSRRLGLQEFVRFTGRIDDAEMLAWVSSADVCVAPDPKDALNDVSSMNKIVEYMAMAKPVIAFDLREARLSAGDAAWFVEPNDTRAFGDALVQLLDNTERRERMGRIGRERFESQLAWEHQQPALLGLYDNLFEDRRS